jgi:hypothetical protein
MNTSYGISLFSLEKGMSLTRGRGKKGTVVSVLVKSFLARNWNSDFFNLVRMQHVIDPNVRVFLFAMGKQRQLQQQ